MPHIFRIDTAPNVSQQDHQDWSVSRNGLNGRIQYIPDTLGGGVGAAKAGTSIPSPFARLYLFDTAFRLLKDAPTGGELSLYQVLISHCFDLLELLFQAGNSADLSYKIWNRATQLDHLSQTVGKTGGRHPHQILGKALDLEFRSDLAAVSQITLIYYKGALLGGTSPLTLVFTSPNWEQERTNRYIEPPKSTNGRLLFQNEYVPLQDRDAAFVTYLRRLYDAHKAQLIGGMKQFLYKVFEDSPVPVPTVAGRSLADFDPITTGGTGNATLEVVPGLPLYHVREADVLDEIERTSDFVLAATVGHYKAERRPNGAPTNVAVPLALASQMEVRGKYVKNTDWDPRTQVLPVHLNDLSQPDGLLADRYLPGVDNVRYPFVSTDDFLEDFLVRMPFKLNNERFFTGMRYQTDTNFLLPVRKEYFNFFTLTDLETYLTLTLTDSELTARLEVPIRGNRRVTFQKTYNLREPGTVMEMGIGMAFFPFYRLTDPALARLNQYALLVADGSKPGYDFSPSAGLRFYEYSRIIGHSAVLVPTPEARSPKTSKTAGSYVYKIPQAFDLIELAFPYAGASYRGLILPQWTPVKDSYKAFTFAVDFGTSNTHVAMLENDGAGQAEVDPKPLDATDMANELQVVLLNRPYRGPEANSPYRTYMLPVGFGGLDELKQLVLREFVPPILSREPGQGTPFAFPLRTTVFERKGVSIADDGDYLFSKLNLGFNIDLEQKQQSGEDVNRYVTNLKWLFENQPQEVLNRPRVRAFFETLLLLMRHKVILNQGDMSRTRVVWLAPSSMRRRSRQALAEEWQKAWNRTFMGFGTFEPKPVPESLAPYFYLRKKRIISSTADAVNIDIGGGTTDVMLFMKNQNRYLNTSFRFAANDIWGGGLDEQGFPSKSKDTGFLLNFKRFRDRNPEPYRIEDGTYEEFMARPEMTAEDVVSLLFKYDPLFKFSQSFKDFRPALRFVLFLHYSAIIYHLTQLLAKEGLPLPRFLSFTGRGSLYIKALGEADLTEFTQLLFRAYTEQPVAPGFRVQLTDNPKETTANGAVLYETANDKADYANYDTDSYWGTQPDRPANLVYGQTSVGEVEQQSEFHASVLLNVYTFLEKTLRNRPIATFLGDFDIRNPEQYLTFLAGASAEAALHHSVLDDSYRLARKALDREPDAPVVETYFFLPLKHALYELGKHIAES